METIKRIGNPLAKALLKKNPPSPKYQSLGDSEEFSVRGHSCHSRLLAFSFTINSVMLVALLGISFERFKSGTIKNAVCELESDRLFGHSE